MAENTVFPVTTEVADSNSSSAARVLSSGDMVEKRLFPTPREER